MVTEEKKRAAQVQGYSQSTSYQKNPYGQQTVVVEETKSVPGGSQTIVTKTVSQPGMNYGNNYGSTNYAQQYGGGYNQFGY